MRSAAPKINTLQAWRTDSRRTKSVLGHALDPGQVPWRGLLFGLRCNRPGCRGGCRLDAVVGAQSPPQVAGVGLAVIELIAGVALIPAQAAHGCVPIAEATRPHAAVSH